MGVTDNIVWADLIINARNSAMVDRSLDCNLDTGRAKEERAGTLGGIGDVKRRKTH